MKYRILTILLCLASLNVAWTQNFETNFKNDICASFEEEFSKVRRSQMAFNNCFKKALPGYAALIDGAINEEDPSVKYRKGQEARKALKQKFQVELVYSCDIYYAAKLEERKKVMAKGIMEVSMADIPKLNELVAMYPISMNYAKRGATHLFLGNLKLAESDLRESININPKKDRFSKISKQTALLALVMEEQNKLGEAKALYAEIYEKTKGIDAAIFQALVNKRLGGTSNNLEFSDNSSVSKTNSERTRPNQRRKDSTENSELRGLFNLDKSKKKN